MALARLIFLRGLRCKPHCGWHGFRFSRSLFRRRKRRLMYALFILLFIATAVWTVRHVISGAGAAPPDDGTDEVE
jgi:zona occludens toxin (predicted ATPase)